MFYVSYFLEHIKLVVFPIKKYNASVVIAIRRWSRTYYLVAKLFFDTQEDNFTIESPQTSD